MAFSPACPQGTALARSGGDRRSRLSTNSQHLLCMASGGQCRRGRRLAEVSLVRCSPAQRLMRTSQIIPVEELGKAALLFDAVGRWAQVDPFVLHRPPQALDKDVVVAAPASIHADLDPVIPQHRGELVAGELRTLIGIEDAGLAEPGEGLAQRLDTEPCGQRVRQPPGQYPPGCPVDNRDQVQKPLLHRYVRYVSCPHLVRLVDRLAAQKVRVDLVLGMPLAGVPFWPDRPQPELLHQPPDPPAANRNPLPQQRHLEPAAAVDRMVCENPVEPLQKLEFLRRFRPPQVIEAAARKPEQRALPAYGQPRFRRNHRPPLSNREMAGCPARKSRSTCSWPILRCRSSITLCASATAGALLPRANSSPARVTSSCFHPLIIVG